MEQTYNKILKLITEHSNISKFDYNIDTDKYLAIVMKDNKYLGKNISIIRYPEQYQVSLYKDSIVISFWLNDKNDKKHYSSFYIKKFRYEDITIVKESIKIILDSLDDYNTYIKVLQELKDHENYWLCASTDGLG